MRTINPVKKAVILLPTYNEKETLAKFIDQVFAEEKNSPGWKYEILVVDSGSPDGTLQFAENLAKKDPRIRTLKVGRGLGVALIEGHRFSLENFKPDALVQLDADGQVKSDVLPRLLKTLDEGYNLAIGSRFVKGGNNYLSPMRRLFSWGSCTFCRIVMGPGDIREFTNSARAFTPELFRKMKIDRIPWREKTFITQPAFLNEAVLAGAKYKEVPLTFKNREEG
ncbi:MAG: glycosyltransferase [Firmicutes bacterium]|nr:glycosyltransferase [Bacillota bacterium]